MFQLISGITNDVPAKSFGQYQSALILIFGIGRSRGLGIGGVEFGNSVFEVIDDWGKFLRTKALGDKTKKSRLLTNMVDALSDIHRRSRDVIANRFVDAVHGVVRALANIGGNLLGLNTEGIWITGFDNVNRLVGDAVHSND
jgi:hypothetical protein